jgi:SAM-dependent methyltransferase
MDAETEGAMEEEHHFIWRAMLRTVDVDLIGTRVLDVGCSQGGFLRMLTDEARVGHGYGYDPAAGSISVAEERREGRPLTFAVADRLPTGWADFDVAFSHEVLYLLHDLQAHAADVRRALRPGGIYYAVMGTHDRNPMMPAWHRSMAKRLSMPPIYSLDDVVGAFADAGFEAHVSRLRFGFIPMIGATGDGDLYSWVEYYGRYKLMFKFVKQ